LGKKSDGELEGDSCDSSLLQLTAASSYTSYERFTVQIQQAGAFLHSNRA
jgi:hypothetical protein